MKTKNHFFITIAISILSINIYAQKLPNVQQGSLRAPANVKVDGKLAEWGAQLKAYNNATNVYYTLGNDNENLYLALKVTDYHVMERIVKHGVRFIVNHSLNKKDASPVVVTYPAMEYDEYGPMVTLIGSRYFEMTRNQPQDNSTETANKLLKARSKFIRVEGISDIADKKIAIYNDKGIAAVSAFEKPFVYVYELAIPLKYLALNAETAFSYQLKINYPDPNRKRSPPPPPGVLVIDHPQGANAAVSDFWGEYTVVN